jgi:hypothetical protein|tara:strand:+ start:460 stop:672 length:213 start_codon:yes stop_codon:yes gene_type:complete
MEQRIKVLEQKFQALEDLVMGMHKKQEDINQQTQKLIEQLREGDNILKNSLVEALENQQILEQKIIDLRD